MAPGVMSPSVTPRRGPSLPGTVETVTVVVVFVGKIRGYLCEHCEEKAEQRG